MDSVRLFFRNLIKYFLYIVVFAQIVSGTVYLVWNFSDFIVYPETKEMVNAARNLKFDEYIGFLYPLFIRVCLSLQDMLGIGYYLVAYLVQLILVFISIFYLMQPFFTKKRVWIASLFVLTFPMCAQTILMVSPFAFKMAFGFFMVGAMVRIWKNKTKLCVKSFLVLLISYALAAFNQPDDMYVWIVPIAMLAIIVCFRKKEALAVGKKICIVLAVLAVFAGSFFVLDKACEPGARGRMHKSVYSVMFQRTIWPDMDLKYGFLPVDMYYYVEQRMTLNSNQYAESIMYYIGPAIENGVGFEGADELYKQAVLNQLSYNKRAIFKAVVSDFAGYLLQPYSTVWYMNGQDGSAFGKLYSLMSVQNGQGIYGYYCVSLVTLFALTFVGILRVVEKKLFMKKNFKRLFWLVAAGLCYQALWYALVNVQGVDFRYSLVSIGIFLLLALKSSLFFETKEETAEPEEEATKSEKEATQKPFTRKPFAKKKLLLGAGGVALVLLLGGIAYSIPSKTIKSDALQGQKIVCFGDSIWGLVEDETGIAALVEAMTGATVENCAISGSTASETYGTWAENKYSAYSLMQIVSAMEKGETIEDEKLKKAVDASLEDADYLILAYGLNDYFSGISIEGENSYDINTYQGALRTAVEYFQTNYPKLRIVLIGQTYCQFYSYGIIEEDSDTRNPGGGIGMDYVEAVEELAKEYDLLFINQYEELPIGEWNGKVYLQDATHLNEKGRKEYATIVSEVLIEDQKERNLQ